MLRDGSAQRLGRNGEVCVAAIMRHAGREVSLTKSGPYDLLVDGWRIDVKTALPSHKQKNGGVTTWPFRMHSAGRMREHETDFYVLRLENVPEFEFPIHLLVRSPIGRKYIHISFRMLLIKWGSCAQDFRKFRRGAYGIKPQLEAINAA